MWTSKKDSGEIRSWSTGLRGGASGRPASRGEPFQPAEIQIVQRDASRYSFGRHDDDRAARFVIADVAERVVVVRLVLDRFGVGAFAPQSARFEEVQLTNEVRYVLLC